MFEVIESRWGNDYHVSIDTVGLDYESAAEAMPRWYGVSFGNGNDGVSHIYPNFYVRTCEPYTLAVAAMLSEFKQGEGQAWCLDNIDVDGESEYTITATLLDPPDDREDYENELKDAQREVDEAKAACDEAGDDDEAAQFALEQAESTLEELESNDPGSWSEHNGAWMICEVFPVDVDDMDGRKLEYVALSECFDSSIITMAREV